VDRLKTVKMWVSRPSSVMVNPFVSRPALRHSKNIFIA
jgi:hypothetical protein